MNESTIFGNPNPERYARVYVETFSPGPYGGSFASNTGDELIAVMQTERKVCDARRDYHNGEYTVVPAQYEKAVVLVLGVTHENAHAQLLENAEAATRALHEQSELREQLARECDALRQETDTLKRDLAAAQARFARAIELANNDTAKMHKLETDLAKVRGYIGDKTFAEALK